MESSRAFSPGHVTGFFSIPSPKTVQEHGSLGAGFSISKGMTTTVSLSKSARTVVDLAGRFDVEAPVSRTVIRLFFEKIVQPERFLHVEHVAEVPIGCGFGTSGAGALSLALALNALFGNRLTRLESAALAHRAEIECKTGLGTVIGETYGGFEIRTKSGEPGYGEVESLSYPNDVKAVFWVKGPFSTSKALSDVEVRKKINASGDDLRLRLLERRSIDHFLELSLEFTEKTALIDSEVAAVQKRLLKEGWITPMLMFGNGLYTLVPPSLEARALKDFQNLSSGGTTFSCSIDRDGGRVIDVV